MGRSFTVFLELVAPFVFSAFLVVLALTSVHLQVQLYLPVVGIAALNGNVANSQLAKVLLLFLALLFIVIPAFRDYSKYFSTDIRFDMHFDRGGLEKALKEFSANDRRLLGIDLHEWRKYQAAYLESLNRTLRNHGDVPERFAFTQSTLGEGELIVRFEKGNGWQKYQIKDGGGSIRIIIEDQARQSMHLRIYYNLVPSSADYIEGEFSNIFFRFTKLLHSKYVAFAQTGIAEQSCVYFDDFRSVTKIRFFPIVDISPTIYLVEKSRVEEHTANSMMIPVGYARLYN